MDKALEGIRVLDLSQFLSGPRCTQILSDMGAEVVKIEPPNGETMRILTRLLPGVERVLSTLHRNKKGITLNLKTDRGKEIFKEMVKKSDVVVENFTPGTMKNMGLDYGELKKLNKGLIYVSISGFGQYGLHSHRTAFDIIAQATGGIMTANKQPDRPPGVFFGDLVSGAYAAIGVLQALFYRTRSGKGQLVDISMQDVMYFNNYRALSYRATKSIQDDIISTLGWTPDTIMAQEHKRLPFWNSFKAKDGYVAVVALTDSQWNRLMDVIGRPDIKENEKFNNLIQRIQNSEEGMEIVESWTSTKTVDEIVNKMDKAEIPCGPVLDAERLYDDPHLNLREMLLEVEHQRFGNVGVPGTPIKLSETPGKIESPAPDLGEHNNEVYSKLLNLSSEEIKRLKEENII